MLRLSNVVQGNGKIPTDVLQAETIKIPVYKWQFRYFKGDTYVYMYENAPHRIYRLIQRLILGVEWKKID